MSDPAPSSADDLAALVVALNRLSDIPVAPAATGSLYTPWTEAGQSVKARHVGRGRILGLLEAGVQRIEQGERPLPLYIFGPRGIGKSHLVALGLQLSGARRTVDIRLIHEDIAPPATAEDLWARIARRTELPVWMRWGKPELASVEPGRTVVFIEGLDRHLKAIGAAERKALRAKLQAHPQVWLVATGARFTGELSELEEAFYGWFQVEPLNALKESEAGELLDHLVGSQALTSECWPARKEALITLAGGNPRALHALGRAVGAEPAEHVASRLLRVLDEFTPHYQLRMRDLADNEQRLLALLCEAPRLLGPTEASIHLGGAPSTWSSVAHRLADSGVLDIHHQGRSALYRIAEPLYRYWLEFRGAPPEQTRIAWLSRLLERVLGPDEMVVAWTRGAERPVRAAALRAVRRNPAARTLAWDDRRACLVNSLADGQAQSVGPAFNDTIEVIPDAREAWGLVILLAGKRRPELAARIGTVLASQGCPHLRTLVRGLVGKLDVRAALGGLIRSGQEEFARTGALDGGPGRDRGAILSYLFDRALRHIDTRGQPWRIKTDEVSALASLPWLRARLYRSGRLPTHAPLLEEAPLQAAALSPKDPDLGALLWVALVRGHGALAARLLMLLEVAAEVVLPGCPLPGRELGLDADSLCRVLARMETSVALTWLAGVSSAGEPDFQVLVDSLSTATEPRLAFSSSHELSLGHLALARPERFEAVAYALPEGWRPTLARTALLAQQLGEAASGPLHPELARVYEIIGPQAASVGARTAVSGPSPRG